MICKKFQLFGQNFSLSIIVTSGFFYIITVVILLIEVETEANGLFINHGAFIFLNFN